MEDLAPTRSVTPDERMPHRMALAYVRWQLRVMWPFWTLMCVVLVFCLVIGLVVGLTARSDVPLLALTALFAVLLASMNLLAYVRVRRACAHAYPAGSHVELRVGESTMWARSAVGTSEVSLTAVNKVYDLRPAAVVLRVKNVAGGVAIFPGGLFTDDDLARLRAAGGDAGR